MALFIHKRLMNGKYNACFEKVYPEVSLTTVIHSLLRRGQGWGVSIKEYDHLP